MAKSRKAKQRNRKEQRRRKDQRILDVLAGQCTGGVVELKDFTFDLPYTYQWRNWDDQATLYAELLRVHDEAQGGVATDDQERADQRGTVPRRDP